MGKHSLPDSQNATELFAIPRYYAQLAELKQRGGWVYNLGDGQSLDIAIGDDTHWLTPPKHSSAGDFTIQLANVFVAPSGTAFGLSEVVRLRGPGADRMLILSRLSGREGEAPVLSAPLVPGHPISAGSENEGWRLTAVDAVNPADNSTHFGIRHEGVGATECIGTANGMLEVADTLPTSLWAPPADEIRAALRAMPFQEAT